MADNTAGLTRIIKAAGHPWKGFRAAWINGAAFRQEGIATIVAVAIVCWLDVDATTRVLLIRSALLVMIVGILNSAIEAVVDCIGSEYHEFSGHARDAGLVAVLLAIIIALITWGTLLWSHYHQRSPLSFTKYKQSADFYVPCGSKITGSCIYSQYNCIYIQGVE